MPDAWRRRTGLEGTGPLMISLARYGVGTFDFTLGVSILS
jgi:hypothetical protein